MKYISLAAHNNELIIIKDMDAFTTCFCYSKKQRHGAIDLPAPVVENADDIENPAPEYALEDMQAPEEDDI